MQDPTAPKEVVRRFWETMQTNDFVAAGAILADDFLLSWPQSAETIRGRDNFVAVNQHYPASGVWRFDVHSLVAEGSRVVSDVTVTYGSVTAKVITFSTVGGGQITEQLEFWPEPFAAPQWRRAWTERD